MRGSSIDRRSPFLWLCVAMLVGGSSPVAAQSVRGMVQDVESGLPVESARVLLVDLSGRGTVVAESGVDGRFVLTANRGGRFTLEVERIGYRSWVSDPLELDGGESIELVVRVGVDAIPLDPIVVVAREGLSRGRLADFERRRQAPTIGGHFLGPEEIARRPVATPSQLLRAVPTVTLAQIQLTPGSMGLDRSLVYLPGSRGSGTLPGSCLAELFVNGVPVRQDPDGRVSVDDVLQGNPVVGVEVYSRASAAPLQYRGSGACGVVLYWTAEPEIESGAVRSGGLGLGRIAVGVGLIGALITLAIAG